MAARAFVAAATVLLLLCTSAAARHLVQEPPASTGVNQLPPPVEATTGLRDKSALTALLLSKAALAAALPAAQSGAQQAAQAGSNAQANAAANAATSPVTVVVSQPETSPAVLPTSTTGGITVDTETPVTIRAPVEVNTGEKRVVLSKGKSVASTASHKDPKTSLLLGALALAGWQNAQANTLNAIGTAVGAVGSFLNAFLPNCPPPAPGAPPIPGCQLRTAGQKALDSAAGGLQRLVAPVAKTFEQAAAAAAAGTAVPQTVMPQAVTVAPRSTKP